MYLRLSFLRRWGIEFLARSWPGCWPDCIVDVSLTVVDAGLTVVGKLYYINYSIE